MLATEVRLRAKQGNCKGSLTRESFLPYGSVTVPGYRVF